MAELASSLIRLLPLSFRLEHSLNRCEPLFIMRSDVYVARLACITDEEFILPRPPALRYRNVTNMVARETLPRSCPSNEYEESRSK